MSKKDDLRAAHEYIEFSYKLFDAPEEIDERAKLRLYVGYCV